MLLIPSLLKKNPHDHWTANFEMASQTPSKNAYVLGVGLTQFLKPRRTREYPELGYEAAVKALIDAKINYDEVQQVIACYCYGDTTRYIANNIEHCALDFLLMDVTIV